MQPPSCRGGLSQRDQLSGRAWACLPEQGSEPRAGAVNIKRMQDVDIYIYGLPPDFKVLLCLPVMWDVCGLFALGVLHTELRGPSSRRVLRVRVSVAACGFCHVASVWGQSLGLGILAADFGGDHYPGSPPRVSLIVEGRRWSSWSRV